MVVRQSNLTPSGMFHFSSSSPSSKTPDLSIQVKAIVEQLIDQPIMCARSVLNKMHLSKREEIEVVKWAMEFFHTDDARYKQLDRIQNDLINEAGERVKRAREEAATSPREVSLREGPLPTVNSVLLKCIEDYMLGKREANFITPENYREVLQAVKVIDLDLDRTPRSRDNYVHSTYALRQLCLQASRGSMNSYEAFTKSINPTYYENHTSPKASEYASRLENYVPERVAKFNQASAKFAVEALAMSRRLESEKPTTFILRGNTAVGKTYASRRHAQLVKAQDDNGEATGSLAPDVMKAALRKGVDAFSNQQSHLEGSTAAQRVIRDLERQGKHISVVRDELCASIPRVQDHIANARATGKPIVMVDIDAPLMLSCLRVLQRDIRTEPCAPYAPIEKGYNVIKGSREEMLKLVSDSPEVASYELWVTHPSGRIGLAARKTPTGIEIVDRELYQFSIDRDSMAAEIASVKDTVIDDTLITHYDRLGIGIKPALLAPYRGMTVKDALLAHSLRLPEWGPK